MVNLSRTIHSFMLGCRDVTVERTTGEWVRGEFVRGEPQTITVRGILTYQQGKNTEMRETSNKISGTIFLLTTERMYMTEGEQSSDVVIWRDGRYKVMTVIPDIDYGFYRSHLERMEGDGIG